MAYMRKGPHGIEEIHEGTPDGFAQLILIAISAFAGMFFYEAFNLHPALCIVLFFGVWAVLYYSLRRIPSTTRGLLMGALAGGPAGYFVWTQVDWIWGVVIGLGVGFFVGANFLALGKSS